MLSSLSDPRRSPPGRWTPHAGVVFLARCATSTRTRVGTRATTASTTPNPDQVDLDADTVGDACDNCPLDANVDQNSLLIDLANKGPILLSGDLFHFPANRELRRVPRFNVDAAATLASMDAIDAFLEESGAELWISHNWEQSRDLRLAPESYD